VTLEELVSEMKTEFPDFSIVKKSDSKFMKLLGTLLTIITFGSNRSFMTDFITTIGRTVYVPPAWDSDPPSSKMSILRHERVHMRQSVRYGRVLYTFLYLFPFFPMFFAYWRAKMEMEAYAESAKADAEFQGTFKIQDPAYRDWMISHFTGPSYGWMWIYRPTIEKWVDEAIAKASAKFPEEKK
jgi:hypothetical protein